MNVNTNSLTPIKVKNGSYKNCSGIIMDPSPSRKSWVKLDGMDRQVCLFKNQLEVTTAEVKEKKETAMADENKNPKTPKGITSTPTPRRPASILRASNRNNMGRSPVVDLTKGVSFDYPSDTPQPERKNRKPLVRRHSLGSGRHVNGRRRSLGTSFGRREVSRRHSSCELRTSASRTLRAGSGTRMVVVSGTSIVPYETTVDTTSPTWIKLHSITAMRQYEHKSFEELRLEDYNQGTRGGLHQNYNKHEWEIDPKNWRRMRRQKGSDEAVSNGEFYEYQAGSV